MADWLFDGVSLASQPGLRLAPGTQLQPATARRMTPVDIAGVDGAFVPPAPPVYDKRQVQIVVNVDGASAAEIADRALNATAILTSVRELTRVHGTQSTKASVVLQDLTESAPDFVDKHVTLTATYLIPGVFFKGTEAGALPTVPNTQAGVTYTRTFTNATAPHSGFRILAQGPISYMRVTDRTTSEWVEWTGTVAAGVYLSIDTTLGTAKNSTTDARSGLISSPSGGRIHPTRTGTVDLQIIRTGGTGTFIIYLTPHYF